MSRIKKRCARFLRDVKDWWCHGKLHRWTFVLSGLFVLFTTGLLMWRIIPLASVQPLIPLHYNIYFGVDRFGAWYEIFVLPALAIVILFVNLAFQAHFFRTEKVLPRLFAFSTLFLQIVFAIAMSLIILLNA